MKKKKAWLFISVGSIALSILSLFLPIVVYRSAITGAIGKYNIINMLSENSFIKTVFHEYTGDFLMGTSSQTIKIVIIILSAIGIVAIILALVGIASMNKQYESKYPFRLAIMGLIMTAIPSMVLLTLYMFSLNDFLGTMRLGVYIIVTPLAMITACLAVTSKYRLNIQQLKISNEAKKYIFPAGDLPKKSERINQYYGQQY